MGERIVDDQGNLICTFTINDEEVRFYGKQGSLRLESFVRQIIEKSRKAYSTKGKQRKK